MFNEKLDKISREVIFAYRDGTIFSQRRKVIFVWRVGNKGNLRDGRPVRLIDGEWIYRAE